MNPFELAVRAARGVSTNILHATDGRDVLLNTPDGWEVEQPWLWWLGPAGSNGAGGGPFGHPIPGAEPWHQWTGNPAVARATSLVVDTLAALPWDVMRGRETLDRPDWIGDPQALRVDGRVVDAAAVSDTRWSWMEFWTQWLVSAFWFGDGYVYVPQRDAFGAPKPPLWVLNPKDVKIEDGAYWVEGSNDPIDPMTLIHLRGMEPIVGGHGSGLFTRFTGQLTHDQLVRDYAAGVFYNGVPAGYLKANSPNLTQDQADALKTKWMQSHGGPHKSIAVLNATTEFHPLTFSPVDAALIEVMQANLGALANAAGIPADMIGGSTDANTYANIESRRRDLYQFTYLPWATRIEAVLDAQLPRGTNMRINFKELIRADTPTLVSTVVTAVGAGVMTIDEGRDELGLPPLTPAEMVM